MLPPVTLFEIHCVFLNNWKISVFRDPVLFRKYETLLYKFIFSKCAYLPSATKLRRLCFYIRVSVHTGGSASVNAGIPPPLSRHPAWSRHPREQTPPWSRNPHPPPQSRHPLGADPPGPDTPPPAQTPPKSRHPSPGRDGHSCGRYASYWNAFLFV